MSRGRLATLVVLDKLGAVRGITDPIPLAMPWWPAVGPIIELVPNCVVLRLLEAKADDDHSMGGEVSYLVQVDGEIDLKLHPWSGSLESHPLRMPWADTGQAAADIHWVSTHVDIVGEPRQCKTWNLSCIWSIPTRQGIVWLKCVPSFFSHESVVIGSLSTGAGPVLIAADENRLLLDAMPGTDGHNANDAEQILMIEALVDIQINSVDCVDELVELGVPDCRGDQLLEPLTDLVDRLAPQSLPLRQLVDELPERFRIASSCGIPDTLVHGDAHSGNCRLGTDPPLWFDWGDSLIGHPLFDLAATRSSHPALLQTWLEIWARCLPGSDPSKAWAALAPVAELRKALVYQRFLDSIEPSEQIYHEDDPTRILRELASSMQLGNLQ